MLHRTSPILCLSHSYCSNSNAFIPRNGWLPSVLVRALRISLVWVIVSSGLGSYFGNSVATMALLHLIPQSFDQDHFGYRLQVPIASSVCGQYLPIWQSDGSLVFTLFLADSIWEARPTVIQP